MSWQYQWVQLQRAARIIIFQVLYIHILHSIIIFGHYNRLSLVLKPTPGLKHKRKFGLKKMWVCCNHYSHSNIKQYHTSLCFSNTVQPWLWWTCREKKTHPFKVEEVFFKGLPGLSLLALVDYIRVFFVAAALVIFTAMSLPVSKTHPAEVFQKTEHTPSETLCTSTVFKIK